MKKPLKHAVRTKLGSYTLSEEQLQRLESLAPQDLSACARQSMPVYRYVFASAVAVFLLAFFLTPLLVDQRDLRERIALEVASNHIKLKPLEVETSSIDGIRDYFDKLDFLPADSELVRRSGLELIGGRYCSLQGITAAQLRLRRPGSQHVQTLYQTEYREDVFEHMPIIEEGSDPVEMYVKGVKVKIWVEKDVLFALTESPDDADR